MRQNAVLRLRLANGNNAPCTVEIREKVYISRSEIFLPDGTVAAYCRGVYYRLKDPSKNDHYHKVYPQVQDRFEIDVPDTEGPWVTEMPEELKK